MTDPPPEIKHTGNAFDFLRIAAASAVLFSHSYVMYGLAEPRPIAGYKLGTIGLFVFFAISGFLVCRSWIGDPHPMRFALKRGLRIFPGLLVVVLLTALVLGSLVTTLPLGEYLLSPKTWLYVASNITAVAGETTLPGVFETNPHPVVVNGSLWTLRYELLMYAVLAFVGVTLRGSRLKAACLIVTFALATAYCGIGLYGLNHLTLPLPVLWRIGLAFDIVDIARLGVFFFASSLLALYQDKIRLSWPVALLLFGCSIVLPNELAATLVLWAAIPYSVLVAAYRLPKWFKEYGKWGDISYGVYVYSFPVQQAVSFVAFQAGTGWFSALAASSLITVFLAYISWHYVEQPALALKSVLVRRTANSFS
jgi:peptidoglycan/LPS O-acetylase OafA/YrhL